MREREGERERKRANRETERVRVIKELPNKQASGDSIENPIKLERLDNFNASQIVREYLKLRNTKIFLGSKNNIDSQTKNFEHTNSTY